VIRYLHKDGRLRNIVVDVGKFWYHSAIDLFPRADIALRDIDAVILTHDHADAVFGLDDLRDWTSRVTPGSRLPIYVHRDTFPTIARLFPYLIDSGKATGSGLVAALEFRLIDGDKPFEVEGLEFIPLPVEHGPDYICLGFRFGRVAYLSDVSKIPDSTLKLLQFKDHPQGRIDKEEKQTEDRQALELLIVDALRPEESHKSHFSQVDALALVRQLRPHKTLFVGMNHESDHQQSNERLAQLFYEGLDVQLAYDGQIVDLHSLDEHGKKEKSEERDETQQSEKAGGDTPQQKESEVGGKEKREKDAEK